MKNEKVWDNNQSQLISKEFSWKGSLEINMFDLSQWNLSHKSEEERIMFAEDFIVKTKPSPFPNAIFMLVFENQT